MKTLLILVGKTTDRPFAAGLGDYVERIGHYMPFELVTIPELKNTKSLTEEQQKTLKDQVELNEATRTNYFAFLGKQQQELGEAITEAADRLRSIEDLENAIRAGQTSLQGFGSQIAQKGAELDRIEAQLKQRVASVQAEQKTAKTMQ